MLNICFLKKKLDYKKSNTVIINMDGIIKMKQEIKGFDFIINENKLKIKGINRVNMEIDFNEVEYVKEISKNKLSIVFNINEKILLE